MFQLRPTIIFSFLLLALLMTTANAGRHKSIPTCDQCDAKVKKCKQNCMIMSMDACQFTCECDIAQKDDFCRESCGMGGPESACSYFEV